MAGEPWIHRVHQSGNAGPCAAVEFDDLELGEVAGVVVSMLREAFGVDVTDNWRFSPSTLAERVFRGMTADAPQLCGGEDVRTAIRSGVSLPAVFEAPTWLQPWLASVPLGCRPVKKQVHFVPKGARAN